MSDFGVGVWRVSQQSRRCIWCGEPIPARETHYHYSGKWDGEWQNWRMHHECHGAYERDPEVASGDGFYPYEHERPERGVTPAEIRAERERAGQLVLGGKS